MSVEREGLLILGNSGRAMAESAARGGYQVTVLDWFCDQDTLAVADCWPVSQGFMQQDLDMFVDEIVTHLPKQVIGLVFGAGLEASSPLLNSLSKYLPIHGNDPDVFEVLSKPRQFFSLLNRLRIPYPEVSFYPPYQVDEKSWLIKRAGSCGGQGVAYFDPQHSAADYSCYYQKYIPGEVLSVLFIADGKRHRVIGYNRLGVEAANPPAPFLYRGAIGQKTLTGKLRRQLDSIIESLVSALSLRGINGIDFVLNESGALVIDVNPRPPATLELYEHLLTDGWIRHHIEACRGSLPVVPMLGSPSVHGHMIVYAPKTFQMPLTIDWPDWARDRPAAGARIVAGQPLCSLFAEAGGTEKVEQLLESYQDEIFHRIGVPACQAVTRKVVL
ncbi:MAG: ATP-grasp domain-containing protein [Candidatus Thiodiazotropha taylori]|uniref:ATP-grasp domain-containing protein n=1 Tax=Candidatus Thiodiazotropha taylori TaxID=2792791 RepID=A0A9E4K983_9GAMM|nr:ATP-grasp domain-containing protein [Candidatus Thiodiazotropha taylori]MCG7965776.1 ATP-grasp domain-containing protein [Candidatus Thiodiazotropha taylori]MCG8044029.1 ATP-grasp domain-containing protein [Candidatus Thiodiazotropha taylori]MCG8050114.1 ATP-grasp domain-containing protein [Candidatus Thiodiazotropha taylori]MCW4255598.1 ATP-grasp domain-containing protein [Candidatus Thiodiazotropha taylori]